MEKISDAKSKMLKTLVQDWVHSGEMSWLPKLLFQNKATQVVSPLLGGITGAGLEEYATHTPTDDRSLVGRAIDALAAGFGTAALATPRTYAPLYYVARKSAIAPGQRIKEIEPFFAAAKQVLPNVGAKVGVGYGIPIVHKINNILSNVEKTTGPEYQAAQNALQNAAKPPPPANPVTDKLVSNTNDIVSAMKTYGAPVLIAGGLGLTGIMAHKAMQEAKLRDEEAKWKSDRKQGLVTMRLPSIVKGGPNTSVQVPAAALPKATYRKMVHTLRESMRNTENKLNNPAQTAIV